MTTTPSESVETSMSLVTDLWESVSITEAQRDLVDHVRRIRDQPLPIRGEGTNEAVAVLVSAEFFEMAFDALEDRTDTELVEESRRAQGDEPGISLEDLRAELDRDEPDQA